MELRCTFVCVSRAVVSRARARPVQTQAIGDSTLAELHRQGERLDGVGKRLDNIESDLSYSQKVIKVMRSPFGWIRNPKIKESEPRHDDDVGSVGGSGELAKGKSRDADGSTGSSNRGSHRRQGSGGGSRRSGNGNWVYDEDEDDEDDDDPDKAFVNEMRKDFKAQDDALDEISGIMGNLKMVRLCSCIAPSRTPQLSR